MRVVAARVPGGPPGRLLYRPQRVRPLHPRVQHRAADDPGFYNQNMQLFQTPDQVVVLNGDGPRRAHRSPRGRPRPDIRVVDRRVERPRWEGDTLVVETTHFSDRACPSRRAPPSAGPSSCRRCRLR